MDVDELSQFKTAVISAVIILNITLNVIVIAVIVKHSQLREDRTTLFMLSLTISDLANGCTAIPISAAVCSDATPNARNMTGYLPNIMLFCYMWFSLSSINSLCSVTVYKMIAITKPLRCEQILTRNRCYYIMFYNWLIGAVFASVLLKFDVTFNLDTCMYRFRPAPGSMLTFGVGLTVALVFPVITTIYATAQIFRAIVRTHRQITSQDNSIGGEIIGSGNIESLTLKSIRSGRNVLILCSVYVILPIPVCVVVIADSIGKLNSLPQWYQFIAAWISVCNTSVNSLIYVVLFRNVRSKTVAMFTTLYRTVKCW